MYLFSTLRIKPFLLKVRGGNQSEGKISRANTFDSVLLFKSSLHGSSLDAKGSEKAQSLKLLLHARL